MFKDKDEDKKSEYPVATISSFHIVSPVEADKEHSGYVILSKKEDKEEKTLYVEPAIFEKYALTQKYIPINAEDIRKKVKESLYEFKHAWLQFGTAILVVNKSKLYIAWGFKNFEDYCEEELKLHQSTVHEIMASTLFLSQRNPELYKRLMAGQDGKKEIPSYHSIYLISKKQTKLGEERFAELFAQVMDGKISSMDLQKKLRDLFGTKEPTLTPEAIASNYEKWYEALKKASLSEDILHKAEELLELLKATTK
jgi:hypothetical protein